MQFQATLTIANAEDVPDVVNQLKPLSDIAGIKIVAVIARPSPSPQPGSNVTRTAIPGAVPASQKAVVTR